MGYRRKMRRYLYLLCLALLGCGSAWAAHVPRARAVQVAAHVYAARHPAGAGGAQATATHLLHWQRQPVIWAVNFDGGGFVLLSADDRAQPILGIGDAGAYDPALRVPGMDFLVEEWSRQVHHIVRNGIAATPRIAGEWARWEAGEANATAAAGLPLPYLPVVVPPLLSTTWNQGCYYNANCPVDGAGACSRTWTGCGATALAQSLKYHAWPPTGHGSHSYVHGTYGTQSANYGATSYSWGAMPNSLGAANPNVAQLMHQCGVALDMNYGTTESTCFFTALNDAMKAYFRYSLLTSGRSKLMYSDTQWDSVLRVELNAARIVPYNGGTHIWVCDGYQTSPDLYHMNWGWGGTYNGYYAHNNLNPGSLTFSTVSCIVGMRPVTALEVEGSSLAFGENGGTATVEVAGDSNWTATPSAGWLTMAPLSGTEGYAKPVVSVPANPGYAVRSGYIAFQRGSLRDTVWVQQAGITPRLSVTPTPIAEGAAGGSRTLSVSCDSNWVVTFADAWIGYAPAAGVGNGTINITIASNPGAGSRTGTLVATRGGITRTVVVNQDGTSAFWCVPPVGVPAAVGATNVRLKTINRTSGISEGYVLAPDSTILRIDSSYTLRVTFSGSVAPAVWVDWNQDGDFFDAAEAVMPPSGSWYPTFGGMKTLTLTVPSTAVLGQTRLRIYVKTFSGGPTTGPCAATNVGDVEDYNVYIQPSDILPMSPLGLALEGTGADARLRWDWDGPEAPMQYAVAHATAADWTQVATLDGEEEHWQPSGGLFAGRYRVAALLQDGQQVWSNVVEHVGDPGFHFAIGPNPVGQGESVVLQLPASQGEMQLRIVDMGGRLVRQDRLAAVPLCYVRTDGWAAGTYVVELRAGGRVQRQRLVVQ